MGAQLWYHEAPWHPDAAKALKALQARFLGENYELRRLLPQHLAWACESLAATKAEGDPYDLLEMLETQLRLLEDLCERPIPENPEEQIEIIRLMASAGGDEIGNVLDLIGVADKREVFKAQRLSEQETARLVGAAQPTLPGKQSATSMTSSVEVSAFAFRSSMQACRPRGTSSAIQWTESDRMRWAFAS